MVPDLIYDVGLHYGDDARYYLFRGFRVVGIEAHPGHAARSREQFKNEIEAGRLTVEEVAISDHTGSTTLWINTLKDDYASLYQQVAEGENGEWYKQVMPVEVNAITFDELLKKHGVPYYLKCDIENGDIFCLDALKKKDLPIYISCEARNLNCLIKLYELGYREFKTVDQRLHYLHPVKILPQEILTLSEKQITNGQTTWVFGGYTSGPFGEDTVEEWEDIETTTYKWLHRHFGYFDRGPIKRDSWYDWHARLSPKTVKTEQPS